MNTTYKTKTTRFTMRTSQYLIDMMRHLSRLDNACIFKQGSTAHGFELAAREAIKNHEVEIKKLFGASKLP